MVFYVLYGICCFIIGIIGSDRPLGFWGHFFGSILLTPLIGILLLAAAGSNRIRTYKKYD